MFEILRETCKRYLAMGVCCCLKACNLVLNILVIELVLGPSFMVISNVGVLLYAKLSPLYNVLRECIVVVYM